jgi:hypothetical protein
MTAGRQAHGTTRSSTWTSKDDTYLSETLPLIHVHTEVLVPSPGGQVSRMACHPDDLPEGYHSAARGQRLRDVDRKWRRGLPADGRAVGLRQVDGMALASGRVRAGTAPLPRCVIATGRHGPARGGAGETAGRRSGRSAGRRRHRLGVATQDVVDGVSA